MRPPPGMKKAGAGPHGGEPASAFDGAAARRRLPFQPEHITSATTSVGSGAVGGLPETAVKWAEEEESPPPPACAGKSAARRHEPLADGNYPRMRGEESNENAASDGMTIPSKSGFSALFPGASPRCRAIPRRGTWGLFGYQASCRGIRYASRSRIVRGPASSSSG